ncbi:MAG TPA: ABC transporter permease [Chitinophaga sp.]
MIRNYFKMAWRALKKNYTFSLINIFGLSVWMTAAIFIMLWVKNEISYDSYHPQVDRIYRITDTIRINKSENWIWGNSPYSLLGAAKNTVPGIEEGVQARTVYQPLVLNIDGDRFTEKRAAYVSANWFNMFRYVFMEGNAAAFTASPNGIVLTERAARKYFGPGPAIGRVLRIDSLSYQVKAVVKDNPSNSSFQFDLMMPMTVLLTDPVAKRDLEGWSNFNTLTFLRLRKDADVRATSRQLTAIFDKNREGNNAFAGLLPLKEMHFESSQQSSSFQHGNRTAVYIFSGMALLLLMIACINYVNLTTARASTRARETGTRRIVGATRRHLFAQFMTETLLLSTIALALTLLLLRLCLPLFNSITEKEFTLSLTDTGIWLILAAVLLAAVLLNGIYPAILLSSLKPLSILRGNSLPNLKDAHFRKGLVVIQFVISIVLIAGTFIIYQQLHYVQRNSTAYNRSQIMTLELPWSAMNKYVRNTKGFIGMMKQELLAGSGVAAIAVSNGSIINLGNVSSGSADWNGRAEDFKPAITTLVADADFASLFNLQLKEGRWFRNNSLADSNNVLLNETAAKELGIQQPVVGQRFTLHGNPGTVIGVVKDFHYKSMHEKIGPMVISTNQGWFNTLFIKVRPGQVTAAVESTGKTWKQLLPDLPFQYTFMDDDFDSLYRSDIRVSTLVLIFSIIAIIIASLGLFGLVAFTAEQRKKEIGIRKILGASAANIVAMLSRSFLLQLLLAALIAFPLAAWIMGRWLQNFAYRISINWWIFAAAAALTIFIALLTVSLQALKAAIANPVKNLRTE